MKLSHWARAQGISYRTAHRMVRAGKMPVPTTQLATGTIIVHAIQEDADDSSHQQATELARHGRAITKLKALVTKLSAKLDALTVPVAE